VAYRLVTVDGQLCKAGLIREGTTALVLHCWSMSHTVIQIQSPMTYSHLFSSSAIPGGLQRGFLARCVEISASCWRQGRSGARGRVFQK